MQYIRSIILIAILTWCSTKSEAQKGIEAGGWIGVSNYFGDLNTNLQLNRPGLSLGIIAKRNLNERLSLRGGLNYMRVSGDDANSPNNFQRNRNLSFRSTLVGANALFEFNFFPHVHGSEEHGNTPYLVAGIDILSYTPTAKLNGERYKLRELGTEGQTNTTPYGLVSGGWVVGGGWKMDISEDVTVAIELSYHAMWTDYLDDVSTIYPSPGALSSEVARSLSDRSIDPDLSLPGRQRGDSTDNDSFTVLSISIVRYWGKLECPQISSW